MQRIRRTRSLDVVESPLPRVRRVRVPPSSEATVIARVRRTRKSAVLDSEDGRELFVIDWGRSLGWKLQIYLVTSYLYYNLCRSIITDHDFDRLCKDLGEGWDTFEHQHKYCTSREDMLAGTGYANTYPLMIVHAAEYMLRKFRER